MGKSAEKKEWSWLTSHEIAFLQHIGSYGEAKKDHLKCLLDYKRIMPLRQTWETIDKAKVEKALNALIAKAETQRAGNALHKA